MPALFGTCARCRCAISDFPTEMSRIYGKPYKLIVKRGSTRYCPDCAPDPPPDPAPDDGKPGSAAS